MLDPAKRVMDLLPVERALLAIVRAFAQMHGGSVNVTTSAKGATFTLVLPIEAPPPAQPPAPESVPPAPTSAPGH